MEFYRILFAKTAEKDIRKLTNKQILKLQEILKNILMVNPYLGKPLKGKLQGLYSYRLNQKDRIVYEIREDEKVVFIIRTRSHYGE